MKEIYKAEYVEELFDDMSKTYSRMNYVSSFGFSERWRKQFVQKIDIQEGAVVADMLTGMGECWQYILKLVGTQGKVIGVDFSEEMLKHAELKQKKWSDFDIEILNENVFKNSIESSSVDVVLSGFGLKTFTEEQLEELAKEFSRILKVGGQFSLVDVSIPPNPVLRFFYLAYLRGIIPLLGRIFHGKSSTYNMLGIYTLNFGNAENVVEIFKKEGFEVEYQSYFFGCATGLTGKKI